MTIQEAREALAEMQSLHAQGWCACQSSSLPARVEQALKEALEALDDRDARIRQVLRLVGDIGPEARRILTSANTDRTDDQRRAAAHALRALGHELEDGEALPPARGAVDPIAAGRKPLIIEGHLVTVPVSDEVAFALHEHSCTIADQLAEILAPHGLHPSDIYKHSYARVVYEDELQQARWVMAAEATTEAVQQLIDAIPGRITHFPQPVTAGTALAVCPECRDGKHQNCTDLALDRNDEWVDCSCECRAA